MHFVVSVCHSISLAGMLIVGSSVSMWKCLGPPAFSMLLEREEEGPAMRTPTRSSFMHPRLSIYCFWLFTGVSLCMHAGLVVCFLLSQFI